MNIGQTYSFWEFLKQYGVVIPLIQRDYAQGRIGKEDLRKRLLSDLKAALEKNNRLILDFVYGVKTRDGKFQRIIPLDGQQRLTTLWLLHWYLFLKISRKGYQKNRDIVLPILQRFTYQTRVSSRSFCEALCDSFHFKELEQSNEPIISAIVGKSWFMSEWEHDPTVKAMLNMLGGNDWSIEFVFKNINYIDFWKKLTISQKNCPISFYYLSIDREIQQEPDDIYIKMNARGEHLTDFENFKADLIKHIRNNQDKWQNFSHSYPELELSKMIDVDWSDVLWSALPNKDRQSSDPLPNTDKQLFAFLNRFFLNRLLCTINMTEKEMNKKGKDGGFQNKTEEYQFRLFSYLYKDKNTKDEPLKYNDFQVYLDGGSIDETVFQDLKTLFITLNPNDKRLDFINSKKFRDINYSFFPAYGDKIDNPTQQARVLFFGACCFLEKCTGSLSFQKDGYLEWMRVVWNIARNSDIQNIENMRLAIQKIDSIKNHTHNIIDHLKNQNVNNSPDSYLERQWNEEIKKAQQYSLKKKLINNAEKEFHGSIAFLLDSTNSLLSSYVISKAKDLLKKDEWIATILEYIPTNLFSNNTGAKLEFSEKTNDVIKAVNRDENIINAVRNYLNGKKVKNPDDWVSTLLLFAQPHNTHNKNWQALMDYSVSRMIRNYFWLDNGIPTGVYLYKGSQWKKKDCILLSSFDNKLQTKLKERNDFIRSKLADPFCCLDFSEDSDDLITPSESHLGRAIVLKSGNDFFYCHVDGYHVGDKKTIPYTTHFPDTNSLGGS